MVSHTSVITSSAVRLSVLSPWPCLAPCLSFDASVSVLLADAGLCRCRGTGVETKSCYVIVDTLHTHIHLSKTYI